LEFQSHKVQLKGVFRFLGTLPPHLFQSHKVQLKEKYAVILRVTPFVSIP